MKARILTALAVVVLSLGLFVGSGLGTASAESNCVPYSGGTCHPCYAPTGYWQQGYYWTGFSWATYYYFVQTGTILEWHSEFTYGLYGNCY